MICCYFFKEKTTYEVRISDWSSDVCTSDLTSCVVVQYPDILGRIGDLSALAAACHAKKALLIAVVTEPAALGALKSPGELDADIVGGEGQSIGVGLHFGGPYVGLIGGKTQYVRPLPGGLGVATGEARAERSREGDAS